MKTLKQLLARIARRFDELKARRAELADAPTRAEIVAAIKAGQAKLDAAAAKAGIL